MPLTLMVCNPNIYADLAMMYDRPTILTWNLVMAKEYGVIGRIMYASDYWCLGRGVFSRRTRVETSSRMPTGSGVD